MATRSREQEFSQPELGLALAWLRGRQYLTQKEVAEEATAAGESVSQVYYQLIEGGKRKPSRPKLDAILVSLQSDREEIDGLVAARVWEGAPRGSYRLSGKRLRPEAYTRAAEQALTDRDQGGSWSSPVAGPAPFVTGFSIDRGSLAMAAGMGEQGEQPHNANSLRRRAVAPEGVEPLLRGELSELEDHFLRLSPKKRKQLLAEARRLRGGAS